MSDDTLLLARSIFIDLAAVEWFVGLPAKVSDESADFVLLEGSCGSFCWYVHALPVTSAGLAAQTLERPLAFHKERSLIAYYPAWNRIIIRNLLSGKEQSVDTELQCNMSGLCFDAVFVGDSLAQTWKESAEEVFPTPIEIVTPVDAALLD